MPPHPSNLINMKPSVLLIVCLLLLSMSDQAQMVTDYDGNQYHTQLIGNQLWLKENLKVTHYRDGTLIPNVTDINTWGGLSTGARCYYDNDSATNDPVYGVLYNWFAVSNAAHLCPEGWHVPTDAEWTTIETFLGGSSIAGGKMKEAGTTHWSSPNTGATNESGFTGLPGGMLGMNYTFQTLHENGLWWSSSPAGSNAWSRYLWYLFAGVDRNPAPKTLGLSVRCIKDIDVGFGESRSQLKFTVYPNPATNRITVELSEFDDSNLVVYDVYGKIVKHVFPNQGTFELDIDDLARGIYFMHYTGKCKSVQQKLIIE